MPHSLFRNRDLGRNLLRTSIYHGKNTIDLFQCHKIVKKKQIKHHTVDKVKVQIKKVIIFTRVRSLRFPKLETFI